MHARNAAEKFSFRRVTGRPLVRTSIEATLRYPKLRYFRPLDLRVYSTVNYEPREAENYEQPSDA